jgi:hypothetical protein
VGGELNPQDIGRRSPDRATVRLRLLIFNPATPQFPAGTIVALVRQMMVINDELQPATSIGYQGNATADWKTHQFDWGLLRGLLEADVASHPRH